MDSQAQINMYVQYLNTNFCNVQGFVMWPPETADFVTFLKANHLIIR